MANFEAPLRGQQVLTLLGSEQTTSSLVVMILLKSEEPPDLKYIRSAVCFRLMQAPEYSVLHYVF